MARRSSDRTHPLGLHARLAAGVIASVMMVAGCGSDPGQPSDTAGDTPPSGPAPSAPVPSIETAGSDDHDRPAPAPPVGQPAAVAEAFAAAWVRALPADQWWTALAPLCETEFAALLASVDPANLPASRVTGPPVLASPSTSGPAVYTIPTDGGTLTITVAAIGGKWLVTSNDFTRAT